MWEGELLSKGVDRSENSWDRLAVAAGLLEAKKEAKFPEALLWRGWRDFTAFQMLLDTDFTEVSPRLVNTLLTALEFNGWE
jgi:hypothetical protein